MLKKRSKGRKTLRDAYKTYEERWLPNSPNHVEYKTYRAICEDFNQLVMDEIVFKGRQFFLPSSLGYLQIIKTKTNGDIYNYGLYQKLGKKIRQLNQHTFGYRCKFIWGTNENKIKNKEFYKYIATRTNKRALKDILINSMAIMTTFMEKYKR